MKIFVLGTMLAILIAAPASAYAATIPGLYPTGVDDSNAILAGGANDPHYQILETNTNGIAIPAIAPWLPDDGVSRWIWEDVFGQPVNVTRTFRTTFDLSGLDPNTASIAGTWATDNFGDDILINGQSTGQMADSFTTYTTFLISSGFVSGINTLDFVVRDVGAVSAFRVGSISGTAAPVPEPSTFALAGVALIALGAYRLRRHRR